MKSNCCKSQVESIHEDEGTSYWVCNNCHNPCNTTKEKAGWLEKQKVIILKGLPASGKSTYAKALVDSSNGKFKRISKDDLRAMLDNSNFSKTNEKNILYVRDNLMNMLLVQGYSVIIDDTNLHPKHEQTITGEVVELMGDLVDVEIEDFTNISLEECIKRDQKRSNYVGEKVIRDMYNRFLRPEPKTVKYNKELSNCVICDLDGTLALFKGNPYERDFSEDKVNTKVLDILNKYASEGNLIMIVSGRKGEFRSMTENWLIKNKVPYNGLFMRKEKDVRKDYIIKEEIYNKEIKDIFNVLFVLDDRNQVVNLWRSLGLTCLQVAEGEF